MESLDLKTALFIIANIAAFAFTFGGMHFRQRAMERKLDNGIYSEVKEIKRLLYCLNSRFTSLVIHHNHNHPDDRLSED